MDNQAPVTSAAPMDPLDQVLDKLEKTVVAQSPAPVAPMTDTNTSSVGESPTISPAPSVTVPTTPVSTASIPTTVSNPEPMLDPVTMPEQKNPVVTPTPITSTEMPNTPSMPTPAPATPPTNTNPLVELSENPTPAAEPTSPIQESPIATPATETSKPKPSVNPIVTGGAVIALLFAVGIGVLSIQNNQDISSKATYTPAPVVTSAPATAANGSVSGKICAPSIKTPGKLYAVEQNSQATVIQNIALNQTEYTLTLPEGDYNFYYTDGSGKNSGYTKTDHTLAPVVVSETVPLTNIDVCDTLVIGL